MRRDKDECALWRAAKSCNVMKLEKIVSNMVDNEIQSLLNQPHPVKGTTPLMIAAVKKRGAETVRALINLGADLNVTDTDRHQNTALHYAAYNNRIVQLEMLLEAGADLLALNGKGHTALDVARLRGRKETAAALTSRLQVHSGWLNIRSKSMLGFWKRRWCVLLACNSKRTATELCIFRSPQKVHPEAVLWQDSLSTRCAASTNEKANSFYLDLEVMYLKLNSRRYSRYLSSGRTHVQKDNMKPRQYVVACDSASSRDAWIQALKNEQRGEETTPRSRRVSFPSRARSRATTADGSSLSSGALSEVEGLRMFDTPVRNEYLVSSTFREPVHPVARASAPTFLEDENDFIWGSVVLSHELSNEEPAAVITIGSDPNEPRAQLRSRCIVCAENHRDSVCIPCGHVAGCYDCMRAVTQENSSCPVCRAHVDGVVMIQGYD